MRINENQKVTLTLGQLKKLVKESTEDGLEMDDSSEYKTYPVLYRLTLRIKGHHYINHCGVKAWKDTQSANLIRKETKDHSIEFVWKPKMGYYGYPAFITFESEEDAEKYVEKYLEDHPTEAKYWKEYGVIYKVKSPFCNRPHKEIDTPYGKCLIPMTKKVNYPGLDS